LVDLERDGDVFVLRLDSGENRFSAEMCRLMNEALDQVEAAGADNADTYLHGVLETGDRTY
jgi:enoyl-CoA hydratase/carnithine racemase